LETPSASVYIDNNRSYDFAKCNFENCDKQLETGGFILFDDSSDDQAGTNELSRIPATTSGKNNKLPEYRRRRFDLRTWQ
jgi:hypothetical protein